MGKTRTTATTFANGVAALWLLFAVGTGSAQPLENDAVSEAIDATSQEDLEVSALETSLELERRLQAIQQAETELGLYDPALIEMYDDLARFYREHGEYEQAVEQSRQALQLSRINTGLNSGDQLPYIDQIIDGSLMTNDWQKVDDMHHLRFYLTSRLYDPADPRYAESVAELGDWKLRVMRENLLDEGSRGIGNDAEYLSGIYRDSIARIQGSPDFSETSLLPLYRGKSQVDLEMARLLSETPYQFFEGTVSRFVYQSVCSNVRDAQGNVVRQCTQIRRENPRYRDSQQDSKRMMVYRSVREVESSIRSLNEILERNPDISAAEREQIAVQIREMEVEFQRIQRNSRRSLLY